MVLGKEFVFDSNGNGKLGWGVRGHNLFYEKRIVAEHERK